MACLFVDQLTVIDCAFLDAARGVVGESWIVDLEMEGELDEQSMVLDFSEVKRRLKRAIDAGPDHTLLVPAHSPALEWRQRGEHPRLRFESAVGPLEHASPAVALTVLPVAAIHAAALQVHLETSLATLLPANAHGLRLHLRTEAINGPYYHYTHGLKKHRGACQRIAHGHRSRLEIRVDGERDDALETAIARRWADIYIATAEDLVGRRDGQIRFAYQAPEGPFELALPEARCELIGSDSTVECLADWLADHAAAQRPGAGIEVRAYEGINKGAVARR